ncbi:MAG: hypothetical protein ACFWUH_01575 [Limosilactobacillus fermentum]
MSLIVPENYDPKLSIREPKKRSVTSVKPSRMKSARS